MANRPVLSVCLSVLLLAISGCSDERAVQLTREAADRQADQNRAMRDVVRTGNETQREVVQVQRDQQAERAEIVSQRDMLDAERRQISRERQRESMLGPLIETLGGVLIIALALGFCSLLLLGLNRRTEEEQTAVQELLLREITFTGPDALPFTDTPLVEGKASSTALTQQPT
jgi:hypothetical protein